MNLIDYDNEQAEVQVDIDAVDKVVVYARRWRPRNGGEWREFEQKPRIYVSVPRETIGENLMNRKRRPYTAYRPIVRAVLNSLGFDPEVKFRWSQKAGCSCPCSPGFILDASAYAFGSVPGDLGIVLSSNALAADETKPTPILLDPTLTDEMLNMRLP